MLLSALSQTQAFLAFKRAAPVVVVEAAPPRTLLFSTFTYVFLASILLAIVLYRRALSAGRKKASPNAPIPPPPMEKDGEAPEWANWLHAYSGYAYLIVRGGLLDIIQTAMSVVCFWRSADSSSDLKLTGAARAAALALARAPKAGPAFNSGD